MHLYRIAFLWHKQHCFSLQFRTSGVISMCCSKYLAPNNVTLMSPSFLPSHFLLCFRCLCDILSFDFLNADIHHSYFPSPLLAFLERFHCLCLVYDFQISIPSPNLSHKLQLLSFKCPLSFPFKCPTGTYN